MELAVQIVTIIFMSTFVFIGIWDFVILNKGYRQLKYKNYILEKIESRLFFITNADLFKEKTKNNTEGIFSKDGEANILED